MEPEQEVAIEVTIPEEGIEPFDWEDYLYEAWLEEHVQKEKRKLAEAGA
jgi:hypothetical protein